MRFASSIAIVLGLLASDAFADKRCNVEFVRVPDDVRLVIESWLEAEPRCTGSIQLRVVPTDKGTYYLVAQRPDGRIHEREVPDAPSAGVLVASWVADDWTSDDDGTGVPASAPAPARAAPSDVPAVVVSAPPPRAALPSNKLVTLGLMLGGSPDRNGGFHLDVDLFQTAAWTFGVTGEYTESASDGLPFSNSTWLHSSDWRVLAKAARVFRATDRLTFTASVGLGIVHTEATITSPLMEPDEYYQDVPQETAVVDAAVMMTRELGDNWGITAGPTLTYTVQEHYLNSGARIERPPVDVMVLMGLRRRL